MGIAKEALAYMARDPARTLVVALLLAGGSMWQARGRLRRWLAVAIATSAAAGAGFVGLAISRDGAPRRAVVQAEMRRQAEEGRLVADARWGLLDEAHRRGFEEEAEVARGYLAEHDRDRDRDRRPLTLAVDAQTGVGTSFVVVRRYRLAEDGASPSTTPSTNREDDALAIALQCAWDLELAQQEAPWWTGLVMSAFLPDDLPSALHAAIGESRVMVPVAPLLAAHAAGHALQFVLPARATRSERARFAAVHVAHRRWLREDGSALPDIFADEPGAVSLEGDGP